MAGACPLERSHDDRLHLHRGHWSARRRQVDGRRSAGGSATRATSRQRPDLEEFFNTLGVGHASHPLSRAADARLQQRAQQSRGAVIVSWWRHPASVQSTGTETAWLADLPGAWVEVYCRCRPSIAVDRFLARRRHPGHLDRDKTRAAERLRFEQLHAPGPLGLGRLITVDTERPVDLPALLRCLG